MTALVSIIIPAYNAELWIRETIESALGQTWPNKEIIVVDDGSMDETLRIAREYAAPQVKVINQMNSGASAARNRGLSEARGDYIQFLDADDLLAPDKIERQLSTLAEYDDGFVAAGPWARFTDRADDATFTIVPCWKDSLPVEWLVNLWHESMMIPAAWLVPRSVVAAAGVWDVGLSVGPNDDGEYFCRIVLASKGVKFCREARSYYRTGIPGSLSKVKSSAAHQAHLRSLELCVGHLLAKSDSLETRRACASLLFGGIYQHYPDRAGMVAQAGALLDNLKVKNMRVKSSRTLNLLVLLLGWRKALQLRSFIKKLSAFSVGKYAS